MPVHYEMLRSSLGGCELTVAVSADRLKKLASNRPISWLRKWPPTTFVCITPLALEFASNEPQPAKAHPIQFLKVWVVEAVDVEPVLGDFGPRTPPLGHEFPQFLWAVDVACESTAHANDGNRGVGSHDDPFVVPNSLLVAIRPSAVESAVQGERISRVSLECCVTTRHRRRSLIEIYVPTYLVVLA